MTEQRMQLALGGLACLVLIASLILYWPFTAEDAYISLRYARNFWEGHGLVFNHGEPVNAMTAPLHVLLVTPLHGLAEDPIALNKGLGFVAALGAGLILWRSFSELYGVLAAVLAVLPSPVLFWSVGGLETPLLTLFVAASVPLGLRSADRDRRAYLWLCVVAGLAFLTRFDSCLYFAPVLLVLGLARFSGATLLAWLAGGLPPVLWLGFAYLTYGDIFPTSYHTKTPDLSFWAENMLYIGVFAVTSGALLALIAALLVPGAKGAAPGLPRWALAAGLVLILGYGGSMALWHMMFHLRFFAPYFPALAGLLVLVSMGRGVPAKALFLTGIMVVVLSAASAWRTHTQSVNAFASFAEYGRANVPEYAAFMDGLDQLSQAIAADWEAQGMDRAPRVLSYAEGILPYRLKAAYIYGSLVSFRKPPHYKWFMQYAPNADYIHIMTPRLGPPEEQMPGVEAPELITEITFEFDGTVETLQLYRNPEVDLLDLPKRVR